MELQRVNNNRIHHAGDLQQTLKAGDMTRGKIVKLYPDQKAAIQFGYQTIIAQLEVPLSTFTSYYFEVQQSSSDVLHLKVLHDVSQHPSPENNRSLLQFLNLKETKARVSLLDMLFKEKIPFNKTELIKAFQLIDQMSGKGKDFENIKEMIVRKLPMTEATHQALSAYEKSSISVVTRDMLLAIIEEPATEVNQKLQKMLEKLLVKPQSAQTLIMREIKSELNQEKPSYFNLLKVFGGMKESIDESTWKLLWSEKNHTNTVTGSGSKSLPDGMKDMTTILDQFKHADQNKIQIQSETQTILDNWSRKIHQALIHEKGLGTTELNPLKSEIQTKLLPQLTHEQSQMIQTLLSKNNASAMTDILNVLQTMSKQQTFQQISDFLGMVNRDEILFAATPKEQFMQQLNVMFTTGLGTGEHTIQTDSGPEMQSMKSLLFQLLHNSDGILHDKASQFLHFINGMHLQSVQETANFMEATIQIPVEKLGLNNDMELEISAHKDASGKINPDYCHILFYLNLFTTKETVIDMCIQKRQVTLTVFNNHFSILQDASEGLKNKLKEGLKELDYELQSVQFQTYQVKKEQELPKRTYRYAPIHQGVDYRI